MSELLSSVFYSKCNKAFRRKTNDISFLFEQKITHIPILIVSAKTFSRPTEAATENCSLKQVFLKNIQNPWKITIKEFTFQ